MCRYEYMYGVVLADVWVCARMCDMCVACWAYSVICVCMCVFVCVVEIPRITRDSMYYSYHLVMKII